MQEVTKRSVLSDIARVFDPLGFLGPLTVQGRMLVQEAWDNHYSWDDALPTDISSRWEIVVAQILRDIKSPIPRWLGFAKFENLSLHAFTDASDRALGVVIYLVNPSTSVFVASKPKVCPIKMASFTVPRKELGGVALGTRFLIFIIEALNKYIKVDSYHLWSDSTLALTWVSVKKPH